MQITEQIIQRIARQVFNQMFPSSLRQSGAVISGSGSSVQYAVEAGHAATADQATNATTAATANAVAWANVSGKPTTFTPPLAASGTRGGIQIGFTTSASDRNYAVLLSNEKAYVNVPWTDHTYSQGSGINIDANGVVSNSGVRSTTINGNYLRVNTGGTDADLTIPYATNSDTCDGLHVHAGRNNEANKIVRTDANGYIQCGWINTTSGGFNAGTSVNKVYCSNDDYIRYLSSADFFPTLENSNNQLSVTVAGQNRKLTIDYAVAASKLTTVSKTAWGQTYWTSGGVPTSISGNMTNVGNISFDQSGRNIGSLIYFDTANSRIGIGTSSPSYKLHVVGTIYTTASVAQFSDIRGKNVETYDWAPSLETIANAPIIRYTKKDGSDTRKYIGSVAQYWHEATPEAVTEADDGMLSMDYGTIALVNIIALAREVRQLKAQIAQLKRY